MSEQMPRQSYDDIAQNGPNEANYDSMEVVAAASGPKAEARRQEMQAWSEHTGAMAERMAATQSFIEKEQLESGATPETLQARVVDLNYDFPRVGVMVGADMAARPVGPWVEVSNPQTENSASKIFRSPATISGPKQPSN